tara:strand:+ start:2524 stop:3693 length:1170 start_codon:yes stop_codon:yes gene_type:complete
MKESQKVKEKYYKDGHVILGEHYSSKVKKLHELYEADKFKARVYFMNERHDFNNSRLVFFMKKNGDFDIVNFVKTYGISKTNRMYSREKRTFQLKFSKNKFTLIHLNRVSAPTISNIANKSIGFTETYDLPTDIFGIIGDRFAWVRFISENYSLHNISLNTFINKKLFTLKKALKHALKCPYPVAKMLNESKANHNGISYLKYYMDYISNVESLKPSWVNEKFDLFYDSLKMAKIVDKKVNASWSDRRLKEEHDKWSKIINDVMFIDCDRKLLITQVFKDFTKFSKYKMITTTKRLAEEGLTMNHCVGSYVSTIESGRSAIYVLPGHTFEVTKKWHNGKELLQLGQIVTYGNGKPNEAIKKEVIEAIENFNGSTGLINEQCNEDDILPF